jgi:hypothetical protein
LPQNQTKVNLLQWSPAKASKRCLDLSKNGWKWFLNFQQAFLC